MGGLWQHLAVVNASTAIVEPPRIPAPPELVARAEALVRYIDDVELVIHHLREYGNHEAWKEAQELHKCL